MQNLPILEVMRILYLLTEQGMIGIDDRAVHAPQSNNLIDRQNRIIDDYAQQPIHRHHHNSDPVLPNDQQRQ